MLVCGTIEYLTSVYLEVVYQAAWWNYNGYFLNLNGRICLEGLLLFGVGSCLVTYILGPIIGNFLDKINKKFKVAICIILVGLIAFDFYASSLILIREKGYPLLLKIVI